MTRLACRNCDGPIRSDNKWGICVRRRECIRARKRERNHDERVKTVNAARQSSYWRSHPEYADAQREKWRQKTAARKQPLVEAQGGLCGCGEPLGEDRHLDHDHSCCEGTQTCGLCDRGVLHSRCNMALGLVMDSPARLRALADYLERTTLRQGSP